MKYICLESCDQECEYKSGVENPERIVFVCSVHRFIVFLEKALDKQENN